MSDKVEKKTPPPAQEAPTSPVSRVQEGANTTHAYMLGKGATLLRQGGETPHVDSLRGKVRQGG